MKPSIETLHRPMGLVMLLVGIFGLLRSFYLKYVLVSQHSRSIFTAKTWYFHYKKHCKSLKITLHTTRHTSLKLPLTVPFVTVQFLVLANRVRARRTEGPSDWTESQLATEHWLTDFILFKFVSEPNRVLSDVDRLMNGLPVWVRLVTDADFFLRFLYSDRDWFKFEIASKFPE